MHPVTSNTLLKRPTNTNNQQTLRYLFEIMSRYSWDVALETTIFPAPKYGLPISRGHDVANIRLVKFHHLHKLDSCRTAVVPVITIQRSIVPVMLSVRLDLL